MFNCYDNERLVEWKRFRDSLETSQTPFDDVINFWSHAPFVANYLDPDDSGSWPDPWHLIIDGKFDDLAICLGMLYTLQLTQRFMLTKYEIHMSIGTECKDPLYLLKIDDTYSLLHSIRQVEHIHVSPERNTRLLYTSCNQK